MRNRILSFAFLFLLIGFAAHAQIVRVTNGQNLQTLITNATAGTTFLVEAGSYGNIDITKRVAIIGPGYFLGSSQQATTGSAVFGTINFKAGSENSVLMSCAVNSNINIGASSVTVSRCFAGNVYIGHDGTSTLSSITNTTVKQCYITNGISQSTSNNQNCTVKNNLTRNYISFRDTFSGEISNNTSMTNSASSSFGIMISNPSSSSFVNVKNNICNYIINGGSTYTNSIYNIIYFNQTSLPSSNKVNISYSSIFVGANASSGDAQYMLSATSPAKGAGEGGVDCGAFGGDEPYVIGGVPSGPVVYQLSVPQSISSGSTLNVTVKARVQN
jgi:hypothetical protein